MQLPRCYRVERKFSVKRNGRSWASKSEAAVEGAGPVDGEFVVVFDGADEMESVNFRVILDAEVVNAEDKCDLSGAMAP